MDGSDLISSADPMLLCSPLSPEACSRAPNLLSNMDISIIFRSHALVMVVIVGSLVPLQTPPESLLTISSFARPHGLKDSELVITLLVPGPK